MIHVILDERGTGKTRKLIKEAAETGAIIVTYRYADTIFVEAMANKMNKYIKPPICWSKYVTDFRRYDDDQPYIFDDLSAIAINELYSSMATNMRFSDTAEISSTAQVRDIEEINSFLEKIDFTDMSGKKLSVKIVVEEKRQKKKQEDIPEEEKWCNNCRFRECSLTKKPCRDCKNANDDAVDFLWE